MRYKETLYGTLGLREGTQGRMNQNSREGMVQPPDGREVHWFGQASAALEFWASNRALSRMHRISNWWGEHTVEVWVLVGKGGLPSAQAIQGAAVSSLHRPGGGRPGQGVFRAHAVQELGFLCPED